MSRNLSLFINDSIDNHYYDNNQSSIVGHYRLKILNWAPGIWLYYTLNLSNFWAVIRDTLSHYLLIIVICMGMIGLILQQSKYMERTLLLFWFVSSIGFITYSYLGQILPRNKVPIPSIVPGYHFLFYLKALESILFGYGMVTISRFIVVLIKSLILFVNRSFFIRIPLKPWYEKTVLCLLILVAFVKVYPSYLSREDFTAFRILAQQMSQKQDMKAFIWIREHTQPTDVFLAPDDLALFLVGASGRKVIAVDGFFSNPYVDWSSRVFDRNLMLNYLKNGDFEGFCMLALKHHVTYMVTYNDQSQYINDSTSSFLRKEFSSDKTSIYGVLGCPKNP